LNPNSDPAYWCPGFHICGYRKGHPLVKEAKPDVAYSSQPQQSAFLPVSSKFSPFMAPQQPIYGGISSMQPWNVATHVVSHTPPDKADPIHDRGYHQLYYAQAMKKDVDNGEDGLYDDHHGLSGGGGSHDSSLVAQEHVLMENSVHGAPHDLESGGGEDIDGGDVAASGESKEKMRRLRRSEWTRFEEFSRRGGAPPKRHLSDGEGFEERPWKHPRSEDPPPPICKKTFRFVFGDREKKLKVFEGTTAEEIERRVGGEFGLDAEANVQFLDEEGEALVLSSHAPDGTTFIVQVVDLLRGNEG
jgi:hypothetical protein